jgi:DNA-binding NarL/FixJ family response regulator
MIRIAIADDIKRIADALKSKIELSPDFKVKFSVPNGKEMIKQIEKNHAIDVILMDIDMPVMNGIDATEYISNHFPTIKVIICSVYDDEDSILDSIIAGATGYLLKEEKPEVIHSAIYQAMEGGSPLNPSIARKTLKLISRTESRKKPTIDYGLTPRQKEILQLLANGLSYEQIAINLFVSKGTVRKHIENLYRKLQVNNKVDAINKLNSID